MDFAHILQTLMQFLSDNLVLPIQGFLVNNGCDVYDLNALQLKFGFGEITWFSVTALDLLLIVIGLMVSITALVLTWRFLKFLTRFIFSLFKGVKM